MGCFDNTWLIIRRVTLKRETHLNVSIRRGPRTAITVTPPSGRVRLERLPPARVRWHSGRAGCLQVRLEGCLILQKAQTNPCLTQASSVAHSTRHWSRIAASR
jgi:hypothetical protein